jgi:hypothetical protein
LHLAWFPFLLFKNTPAELYRYFYVVSDLQEAGIAGILVVSCLQSLSFDTVLSPAATSAKAAVVRLYYAQDWEHKSAVLVRPATSTEGGHFEEVVSTAAATVSAANLLASSDKLR